MSFRTFINDLKNKVSIFFKKIPAPTKRAIEIGVIVTENIKKFTDTSLPDILVKLTEFEGDDVALIKVRAKLPMILSQLKLASECGQLTDPNEIVACAVKTLNQMGDDYKAGFLHTLSILIAQAASDGKLSWSDGVYLLQWYFENKYKK